MILPRQHSLEYKKWTWDRQTDSWALPTVKMSKGPLILWLLIELGRLFLTPTTTHSTTHLPKATSAVRTATTALPTMAMNIPELTTRTPLQTRTTTALTTVATTCPPTRTLLPEATTVLPTAEFSTEGPILTAASETFFLSSDSERSTEVPSGNIALFTSQESEDWVLQSTSQVSKWEMSDSVTFPQTGGICCRHHLKKSYPGWQILTSTLRLPRNGAQRCGVTFSRRKAETNTQVSRGLNLCL
uniref:Uncharacterized protein n=1 Tax=Canis lupus familiaris TaxID=9615 RepID=A0A8C0RYZ1_CANLF